MPIFVSRFSSGRTGLANFLSLRTSGEDARANRRGSASQDQERDQAGASDEDQSGAVSRLLVSTQQADQIARRIADQTNTPQVSRDSASGTSAPETAAETASAFSEVSSSAAAGTPRTAATTASKTPATAAPTTGNTAELTIAQQTQLSRRAQQTQTEQRTEQTRQNQADVRLSIQPALRSTVRRLDNLTRLISAQRRDQNTEETATASTQTGLTTSLRISQSAAQASVIRTAQAVQTARVAQIQETIQEPQARTSSVVQNARETTTLKQNLREDVITVTRGLIRDAAQQSTQNARQIAQSLLQSQAQPSPVTSRTSSLTRPTVRQTSILGSFSSGRGRQTPTISNLSPLRSALALLGTKVNILVG